MENVVLTIHLLLALVLIGVVLLQRSEGGGLGIGGGGGGGVISGRSAATALGKVTWGLAVAFICTSIALTVIAARNSSTTSVVDRITPDAVQETPPPTDPPAPPIDGDDLLPPGTSDAPLPPPRTE